MLTSYSVSSLGTFQECPRKFKFEKIEKVKTTERVAAHIYLGQAVHDALARLYETSAQGKLLSLDDIIAAYLADWEKPPRGAIVCMDESFTVDDYITSGKDIITRYYEKYKPFNDGTLLGVERRIPFVLDGTPFKFNAQIDRLWKRADGVVEIWDYKTGKEMPRKTDLRFRMQMGLYHLAVKQNWPQFESIHVVQHALRQDEIISDSLSADELDEIAERFRVAIFETLAAERTDDFAPREGQHCRWCDYVGLCPAKIHKRFIEGEESSLSGEQASAANLAADLADRYRAANDKYHAAERERKELHASVVEAARELGVSKLSGATGDVTVRLRQVEEFPLKSDEQAFAEVSSLVRHFGIDTALVVDTHVLKKLYDQNRLPPELLKGLASYLQRKERPIVSAPRKKGDESSDSDDES
jgi:putative RecB family exonuclease